MLNLLPSSSEVFFFSGLMLVYQTSNSSQGPDKKACRLESRLGQDNIIRKRRRRRNGRSNEKTSLEDGSRFKSRNIGYKIKKINIGPAVVQGYGQKGYKLVWQCRVSGHWLLSPSFASVTSIG